MNTMEECDECYLEVVVASIIILLISSSDHYLLLSRTDTCTQSSGPFMLIIQVHNLTFTQLLDCPTYISYRSCPYWEVGCSPTSSDGVVGDHVGGGSASSPGNRRPVVVVGQISTILIIAGAVAFVVFFVIVGAVFKKRQRALVVRTGEDDPPSSGMILGCESGQALFVDCSVCLRCSNTQWEYYESVPSHLNSPRPISVR